jgi:hypothetical protein
VSLLVPWLVFPIVLGLICLGCGTIVARLANVRLGPELPLPLGFAAIVVVSGFAIWIPGGARFATPVTAALGATGLILAWPFRRSLLKSSAWALCSALAVLIAYGAPTLLSGEATFAGYITLDDSATWFALADRSLEAGRSTSGLEPSSYEATLAEYLLKGYPVGSLLPLGIGATLVGEDVAWVFQPYLAFLAGVLALSLFALARPVVPHAGARAAIAFVAAQPALLYAYAQWTGVKEVAAAGLIPLCCAFAATQAGRPIRQALPAATAIAALLGVLTPGGVVWLVGAAVVAALGIRHARVRAHAIRIAGATFLLALPSLGTAVEFARKGRDILTSDEELGNLPRPLDPLQIAGIWPSIDFRERPDNYAPSLVLIALVVVLAGAGILVLARRRERAPLAYVATVLVGVSAVAAFGSPWVDGKAFATASPAAVFAALLGSAWLFARGRRVEAGIAAAAVAGGVLWSNALAYHGVSLAPREQLAELESIGKRYRGQGPTLMTEYQPHGVRHFLRRLDPEGASELRRRLIPKVDGTLAATGESPDLDQLALAGLFTYRTLVLRRSPAASRPPSPYELRRQWRWYEVWQRPVQTAAPARRLALGDAVRAAAVPRCDDVLAFSKRARVLAVAEQEPTFVLNLPSPGQPASIDVPGKARYSVWLDGSVRVRAEALVDGRSLGGVRHHLNNANQYVELGTVALEPGRHSVAVRFERDVLRPGASGALPSTGTLVVAPTIQPRTVEKLSAEHAASVCSRRLDWVEAFG